MADNKPNDWKDLPIELSKDDWQDVPIEKSAGTEKEARDLAWMQGLAPTILAGSQNPMGLLQTTGAHLGLADSDTPEARKYARERDEIAGIEDRLKEEHPWNYGLMQAATGMAIPVAKGAGLVGSGMLAGGLAGLAGSREKTTEGMVKDAILSSALGGAVGGAGAAAGPVVSKALSGVGGKLGSMAEKLAEKATGATGREAERFQEGAGRQLLDRGIVKFGSSPDDIARAAEGQSAKAEKAKSGILTSLDAQGGSEAISKLDIVDEIERQIVQLRKDPGNGPIIRQLEAKLQDVQAGQDIMSLAEADAIKRNFGRRGYRNPDPDVNQAEKTMEEIYRKTVEGRAEGISPQLASEFKGAKNTQSLLIPVERAAERRASTLNQSPLLSARDALGGAVGGAVGSTVGGPLGGLVGAATGAAFNRTVSPRLPAAGAVAADRLGRAATQAGRKLAESGIPEAVADKVAASPYGQALLRDPARTLTNHYILTQTDSDYRKLQGEGDE